MAPLHCLFSTPFLRVPLCRVIFCKRRPDSVEGTRRQRRGPVLPSPGALCPSCPAPPASAAAAAAQTLLSLPVWCPELTARLKSGESFLLALGQASLNVFVVCLNQNAYFMRSSRRISQFSILWYCSINFHPLLSCRYLFSLKVCNQAW